MKTDEIRRRYIEYFKERGHKIVPSDSLVPANDPSLLFTGAGMNQFKEMFLGRGKMEYTRAVSSQKCLRTGDIENVGRTAAHHTFFEMLGNFSFGDYFKKETIAWAWDFLLNELKIPEGRLSVSVYQDDEEAYRIWSDDIGLHADRIYRFDAKENYWPANAVEAGPNGPCGPCSEIFVDQGADIGCGREDCDPSCDCDRFVEIWNLVFTQFERRDGGHLEPLPQTNIDTGMGLERIAAVMQGKLTNFEIDILQPLLDEISRFTGTAYGTAGEADSRIRRVADHGRAVTFMIADGVLPSNEGRGYVLRRLLRRAVSDCIALGAEEACVYRLVAVVSDLMGGTYPEVADKRENIARIIKAEEERFRETLSAGEEMLDGLLSLMKKENRTVVSGQEAFRLHDTYGYPLEFLIDRMADEGYEVDVAVFNSEMEAQRERARTGSKMAGDIFAGARSCIHDLAAKVPATDFAGYRSKRCESKVVGIMKGEELLETAGEGDEAALVLDKTPFYAASGGQVGDTGVIRGDGFSFEVADVYAAEGLYLHLGKVASGEVGLGSSAVAEIDFERRMNVMRNHTATHLLHHALRKRLGDHVEQAGSLVEPERLRFDFTHFEAMKLAEIQEVERTVNAVVADNLPVDTYETSLDAARNEGIIGLFGEKYGQEVRVVKVGGVSAELCGGTHLEMSGSIGFFKIVSEESVAQGVRRINAVTGAAAVEAVHDLEDTIRQASTALDVPPSRLVERAADAVSEARALRKEIEKASASKASDAARDLLASARDISGVRAVVERLDGLSVDQLRKCIDGMKKEKSLVSVLGSVNDGKVTLISAVSADLAGRGMSAVDIIKAIARAVKGGGGGRPEMAQAGGKDPEGLDEALKMAVEEIGRAAGELEAS